MQKSLKKTSFLRAQLLGGLALGLAPGFSLAASLNVDPAHSSVGFAIKHLVVATVNGNFTDFSGVIDLDDQDLTRSKVNFEVKTASINTSNTKRDEHLRSADFFDVTKYPTSTFVSTSIKKKGKDKHTLEGDLSLHGITKKTTLEMVSLGKVKDPFGVDKQIFQATTTIKRSDFGITYNAPLGTGGLMLGEDVKLTIDLQAAPPAPAK